MASLHEMHLTRTTKLLQSQQQPQPRQLLQQRWLLLLLLLQARIHLATVFIEVSSTINQVL
jgi:hypothetical protein